MHFSTFIYFQRSWLSFIPSDVYLYPNVWIDWILRNIRLSIAMLWEMSYFQPFTTFPLDETQFYRYSRGKYIDQLHSTVPPVQILTAGIHYTTYTLSNYPNYPSFPLRSLSLLNRLQTGNLPDNYNLKLLSLVSILISPKCHLNLHLIPPLTSI